MKPNKNLLFLALLVLNQLFSATCTAEELQIPDMGDSTGALISPVQEKILGESFFRSIRSQLKISHDPDVQEYIQSIGQTLVANSDNPSQEFYFFVVLSDDINAFAGPGGYIGINSGLILNSNSESELASVIAHEIAHVTQRHIYRAYEASSRMSLPAAAAMIAAIIIATQAPEVGIGALSAIQAGSVQMQIDFTRDNEQEADRIGIKILERSGFDPRSMPAFFEKLQHAGRYYGEGAPEFLRTHPVTSSRISDTRGRAEKYPYRQVPDSQNYRLTKAKLRIGSENTKLNDLVNYFQNKIDQGTAEQRAAMQYGLGLTFIKKLQFNQAAEIFQSLNKRYPRQREYLTALAQVAVDKQDFATAKKHYLQLQKQYPGNAEYQFQYISILLKSNQPELALQHLKLIDYQNQQHPRYFQLLARAYGNLGRNVNLHRYMAEYFYAMGYTDAAIMQIKLAQNDKGLNFYQSAILEDRLHFFQAEMQTLKALQE
ncbi:peptidase M48 Ste24p [Methylococcaceae bacterium HT4]|nr:M48 family metallopeptidase [Methyloprofundus sp.]TXK94813.1 peptidase M48 Ste24p [Methylococcaceae bacterium CS4]TXL01344.1 peptidase M48 Ste24p [Methylococcaceae bacterium CS5]TXL03024.1 peptidase M48 Ste24p [Methylococcaceae bacterium CS3]TXL08965.1 peptidase M48 Ste24p [Methylococcaceae bacterium CS1]TXL09620.1 peptidase M48 Ste24p [Methylococcaceae bacterium CS2]TXL16097.1 peptidase M48 Ste24p [Methylococcaceae bacterium HT4]TXL20206.1 peptidase M48 Ste24p [Methylococcaceae bacterium